MDFLDSDSESEQEALAILSDDKLREKALAERPPGAGVLAFHPGVEEALLLYVDRLATDGDATSVLLAVDNYCYARHWMMHVGDRKGVVVEQEMMKAQNINCDIPNTCAVEIGSYCGYSAVRIARNLKESEKLYSIESEGRCRTWTERLLKKAGLSHKVCIIDSVDRCIEIIQKEESKISFLFIDHAKERYVTDLIAFERSGLLLSPGCVVAADNILSFNIPLNDYIDHICQSGLYADYNLHQCLVEYTSSDVTNASSEGHENTETSDGIAVAVFK